jgi:hypothetical protein
MKHFTTTTTVIALIAAAAGIINTNAATNYNLVWD